MARERQTDLAVLGALSIAPMTGYALREGIRDVLGQFWSESFGQIYPTLARLEGEGHVARRASGRASVYALTPAGRVRLRELLAGPATPTPPRNGLLLRLFFGHELGPEACRALVEQHRVDALASLAGLEAARAEVEAEPPSDHRAYALLTVSAGEHGARAAVAWADEALALLDELAAPPSPAS